ncbi:YjbF family lipoprotein [Roseovarius sp. S4756]|uniref:YjbF family lipoprotein n=1 Tax=Roseovarius maritimus TaxID=3342637 RepID=UPI003728BB55
MSVTVTALRRAAIGLACLAGVSACSNAPDRQVSALSIGKSIFSGRKQPQMPSASQIANDVAKALTATDAPLILLTVPNRKAVTVMQQLEQNRGYKTFGTADRRSLTMHAGMMTATRGLGNDIMSSRLGALPSLITSRNSGTAEREMRYLDGEELTRTQITTCTVRIEGIDRVDRGSNSIAVTNVSETCRGDGAQFTNTYKVGSSGQILQSRQWHSPLNQYFLIQSLR